MAETNDMGQLPWPTKETPRIPGNEAHTSNSRALRLRQEGYLDFEANQNYI